MSEPDLSRVYHDALHQYQSDPEAAVQQLRGLIEKDPAFEDAREALTVMLYNQKRYDDAIQTAKQWIAVHPQSIMARTNLSRCYVAKGMIAEAEREQAEARRLTWLRELKDKKKAMPQVHYPEQIERFKQVIAFDPKDVLGYFSLGRVYLEAGQKREAVDTFEKAVQVDPKHSASYLGWGEALQALGDTQKARRIFEQGIRIAESQGDVMTQKKMESYLRALGTKK